MVNGVQNIFLKLNILHLLIFENDVLPNTFHSIEPFGALLFNEEDLTERALTDHLANLEIRKLSCWLAIFGKHCLSVAGH